MTGRRTVVRWAAVVSIIGIALILGWILLSGRSGSWRVIRSASQEFVAPRDWMEIGRSEAGSNLCFVSCDEPRIYIVYEVPGTPTEACSLALEVAEQQLQRRATRPSYLTWCGWQVALAPSSQATLSAGARISTDLIRNPNGVPWQTPIPLPTSDVTILWLKFNSGID